MKKSLRIFGALLALTSLTACQDLGSEVTEAQAAQKQAEITKDSEEKSPHAYTVTMSESLSVNAGNEKMSGKGSVRAGYDLDKLYIVLESKESSTVNGKTENEEEVHWIFYKDKALHYVTRRDGKNVGYKTEMTEVEAKAEIAAEYLDTGYASSDVNGILEELGDMTEGYASAAQGLKTDLTKKYYSKGDGNLSVKVTQKGSMSAEGVSMKFNLECVVTVDSYILSYASAKLSYSASAAGEKASASISATMKGSKGCKIEYPTYTVSQQ